MTACTSCMSRDLRCKEKNMIPVIIAAACFNEFGELLYPIIYGLKALL
jgi:hypothetical protein